MRGKRDNSKQCDYMQVLLQMHHQNITKAQEKDAHVGYNKHTVYTPLRPQRRHRKVPRWSGQAVVGLGFQRARRSLRSMRPRRPRPARAEVVVVVRRGRRFVDPNGLLDAHAHRILLAALGTIAVFVLLRVEGASSTANLKCGFDSLADGDRIFFAARDAGFCGQRMPVSVR